MKLEEGLWIYDTMIITRNPQNSLVVILAFYSRSFQGDWEQLAAQMSGAAKLHFQA